MRKKIVNVSLLFCTSFFLLACGSQEVKKDEFAGFLSSYAGLEYVEDLNAYRRIDASSVNYKKIILEPVVVKLDNEELDQSEITKKMTAYVGGGLYKELEEAGMLTTEPGPETLRLRTAITGAKKTQQAMKAYQVIPIAAIYEGVKAISGSRSTYIDTYLEIELVDSLSGEQIAASVVRGIGETEKKSGDEFSYEDTIVVMDGWLKRFDMFLSGIKAQ